MPQTLYITFDFHDLAETDQDYSYRENYNWAPAAGTRAVDILAVDTPADFHKAGVVDFDIRMALVVLGSHMDFVVACRGFEFGLV